MDDDDKKSEDEAAEPAPDAALNEGAELREVSEEELKQIRAAHETWLETDVKEGTRAHLRSANLQGANLSFANLEGADLEKANLQGANLRDAKLQGANLFDANLQGADLRRAQNLTREQLDEACGDDKTKVPDYLADYQMKPCPEPEQPPSN